jgi:hypothetical protein
MMMLTKKLQIEEEKLKDPLGKNKKKPKPSLSSFKQNVKAIHNIIVMPGISSYSKLPRVSPNHKTLQFIENSASGEAEIQFMASDEEAHRMNQ